MNMAPSIAGFLRRNGLSASEWEVKRLDGEIAHMVSIVGPLGTVYAEGPRPAVAYKRALIELHRRIVSAHRFLTQPTDAREEKAYFLPPANTQGDEMPTLEFVTT